MFRQFLPSFTFLVGQNLEGRMNKQLYLSGEGCCKIKKEVLEAGKGFWSPAAKRHPEVFLLFFYKNPTHNEIKI